MRPASSEMTAATTGVHGWSLASAASASTAEVCWLMNESLEPGDSCDQGNGREEGTGSVCTRESSRADPSRRDSQPDAERLAHRVDPDPCLRVVHRAGHYRGLCRHRDQDAPPGRP